ncbi:MAG: hypothetical protein M4579_002102 [Chaenotheca gracillima]|nr:MAG: hypothetical protein M4579_002102 [Chaenotheca gracillima]
MKGPAAGTLRAFSSRAYLYDWDWKGRDSKKLLSALTSSFRKHLDHEHPPPQKTTDSNSNARELIEASLPWALQQKPQASPRASDFTDQHLRSLLTHPMFAREPASETPPGLRSRTSPSSNVLKVSPQVRDDPNAWFEGKIRQGAVTLTTVERFLKAQREKLATDFPASDSGPQTRRHLSLRLEAMRHSFTGSRVAAWLWSSGEEGKGKFLEHPLLVNDVVAFLVAEGRQDVIWRWMRLRNDEAHHVETMAALLRKLVLWERRTGSKGLEGAIASFCQAHQHWNDHISQRLSLAPTNDSGSHPSELKSAFFRPAGLHLAEILVNIRAKEPSQETVDAFIKTLPTWTADHEIWAARLRLRGPQSRDPTPALRYLQKVAADSTSVTSSPGLGHNSKLERGDAASNERWQVVYLGLETARLLSTQQRYDDCAWVLSLLQRSYAAELDLNQECRRDAPSDTVTANANIRQLTTPFQSEFRNEANPDYVFRSIRRMNESALAQLKPA